MTTSSSPLVVDSAVAAKGLATTEVVVGVDHLGACRPAVALIDRLKFPSPHLTLIHIAAERLPFIPAVGSKAELACIEDRYSKLTAKFGHAVLREGSAFVRSLGLSCDETMIHGNAPEGLIREAESRHADVMAVNCKASESGKRSYIGSVPGALLVGSRTSILISKGEGDKRDVFRAVFATDHSPFSLRCLDLLVALAPKGIDELHVVTAWDIGEAEAELQRANRSLLGGDAERWIEEAVEERNLTACERLEHAGYKTTTMTRRGNPNEALQLAMSAIAADLLILGAQGAGATPRTLIGSVALHQATVEPYPVFILRPKEV